VFCVLMACYTSYCHCNSYGNMEYVCVYIYVCMYVYITFMYLCMYVNTYSLYRAFHNVLRDYKIFITRKPKDLP